MDLLDQATTTHPTLKRAWVDAGFKTNVVERTLGWIMQHRRLARDYETRPENSASMITIAMIDKIAKRLTGETTPTW